MSQLSMVALTDYNWYKTLRSRSVTNEVNFWTPTPWNIRRLSKGDIVYFLLKKKYGRKICGYGRFVAYKNMDIKNAWQQYGPYNGASSFSEMKNRVANYTNKNSKSGYRGKDHIIGCVILKDIKFFDDEDQLKDMDYGWRIPRQVVKYKYVVSAKTIQQNTHTQLDQPFTLVDDTKTYTDTTTSVRKGQNNFRDMILAAYNRKCCITQENTPDVLQAAHIQGYRSEASNHVQNGLLLRVDLHRLFDAGLITIDDNYIVQISSYLLSDSYIQFNGMKINLPELRNRPSLEALRWHYKNVFRP